MSTTIAADRAPTKRPFIKDGLLPEGPDRFGEKRLENKERDLAPTRDARGSGVGLAFEHHVENDLVILRIVVVFVLKPLYDRSMNLHVSTISHHADANEGIPEIRTSVGVQRSDIKDVQNPAVGSFQRLVLDVLPAPDEAKESLVNIECVLSHGVMLVKRAARSTGCRPREL